MIEFIRLSGAVLTLLGFSGKLVELEGGYASILFLRIIAGTLLGIWLLLVLIGKGGFVHLLVLNGIAVAVVDIVYTYRSRATQ